MRIRQFQAGDDQVVSLWTNVFGYPAPHNDPAIAIRRKLVVDDGLFFVAELKGVLVGTIMAGYDGHRGWLYSLAVAPAFRRRGFGAALMWHAEQELRRRDCPKINLQILATNEGVAQLYQRLGYRVEDRISMGKVLA